MADSKFIDKLADFFKKVLGFLFADSSNSSMRLGFLLTIIGGLVIMFSVARYINTFADKGIELNNWTDMGIFLVGVGTIMTGVAWMKERQKKTEVDAEIKMKENEDKKE